MIKEQKNEVIEKDYFHDLQEIKEAIRTNQNKAMVVVNSAMIMTYYEIGTIINKRKTWGSKYIKNLANDLKYYGKGYSERNLQRMVFFSKTFKNMKFCPKLGHKFLGEHYMILYQRQIQKNLYYGISMKHIKMVGLDLWY